jgi:hypothetical protein
VPLTVEAGGAATVTAAVFRSTAGEITAVAVAEDGSLTVGDSQLVGDDGGADPFPCVGTLPDCAGEHDGSVVVEGPSVITMAVPLVCDAGTGECLSDLCLTGIVDCGEHGTCVSPLGTCECSKGYSGGRCGTHTCCSERDGYEGCNCCNCNGATDSRWGSNIGFSLCCCIAGCCDNSAGWCDANHAGWDSTCDRDC